MRRSLLCSQILHIFYQHLKMANFVLWSTGVSFSHSRSPRWVFFCCHKIDQQHWCTDRVIGAGIYANGILVQSWEPETLVFHAVLAWLIVVALLLTICFRVVDTIYSHGHSLIKPFDILSHEHQASRSQCLKKEWIGTFNILFGRSIWKKNFV